MILNKKFSKILKNIFLLILNFYL